MRIYMKANGVENLGPFKRYVLWVQGCLKSCEGCVARSAQDRNGGEEIGVMELAGEILSAQVEGLTISGGEPFLQSKELAQLIRELRKVKDLGVIVYSGYTLKELESEAEKNPDILEFMGQIDTLIDGEYINALDDGGALRGSSNQNLIHLTPRYSEAMSQFGSYGRKNNITIVNGVASMIGIPNSATKVLLGKLLR